MKKVLIVALAVLAVSGCRPNPPPKNSYAEQDFTTVCLDGVEYWFRVTGYHSFLTPRISPETLMPTRCEIQP